MLFSKKKEDKAPANPLDQMKKEEAEVIAQVEQGRRSYTSLDQLIAERKKTMDEINSRLAESLGEEMAMSQRMDEAKEKLDEVNKKLDERSKEDSNLATKIWENERQPADGRGQKDGRCRRPAEPVAPGGHHATGTAGGRRPEPGG